MYTSPPKWKPKNNAGPAVTNGYTQAQPGANYPQSYNVAPPTHLNPPTSNAVPQNNQTNAPSTQQMYGNPPQTHIPPSTPVAQNAAPVQHDAIKYQNANGTYSGTVTEYISRKIWKVCGKNKVVDFTSKLIMANVTDFANIHGCGGKGHAGNSTIGITLCDYTNGKGDKSITVKYSIDVEDIDILYNAAMSARLGQLKPDPNIVTSWIDNAQSLLNSWKCIPPSPDNSRSIPNQALNAMANTLNSAKATANTVIGPYFTYAKEKNNPYAEKNNIVPCSKIVISYSPYRKDGSPSLYPWYIEIENFDAPLKKSENGATIHNSAHATNKKKAFINLSGDDFCAAMVAIKRFVALWEHRALPVMEEAYRRIDAAKNNQS